MTYCIYDEYGVNNEESELHMPENEFLRYEASGIAALLRTRTLSVPFYQRSYSWATTEASASTSEASNDKQQVVDFWDDLHRSYVNKVSYFLGTVVLAASDETGSTRKLVIDGQQRLATASLLLAAIRDQYQQGNHLDLANNTQQEYLGKFDRQAREDKPKLILNTDDRDFYERRVVRREDVTPANYSQELLADAYSYLKEKVAEFAKSHGSAWDRKLSDLEEWLDSSVQIVAIVVASEADAFLIFETLNDRGSDLTVADLLKNFLFSQAGSRLDEVRDNWVATLNNLDTGKVGNQRFTTFARHLLSSKYGLVREREVYSRLKGIVSGPAAAVQFAQELKDSSRQYYALLSNDSDYWSDYSTQTSNAADVLVDLKIERYRPLVLAVMASFSKSEIERFVPALVAWSVRMLCAGNLGGGTAEAAFCEAAQLIRKGQVTTTDEILSLTKVGGLVPSDEVFHPAFIEWRVTSKLSRYLLRALELANRNEPEPELVVNADVDQVNLEHVLPKNATSEEWPQFSVEQRKLLVDRLGNHCLLSKGPNGRIGNKGWIVKKPVLLGSSLTLTKSAGQLDAWSQETINARQRQMADLAVSVWPRSK